MEIGTIMVAVSYRRQINNMTRAIKILVTRYNGIIESAQNLADTIDIITNKTEEENGNSNKPDTDSGSDSVHNG